MRIHAFIVMLCATLSLSAQNVTGRITCKGKGVPNVVVSDGYELTKTNQAGYYELRSLKQNGYVFYTLPSGYEPEVKNGFYPMFWAPLTEDTNTREEHNFQLKKVKNKNHYMVAGADSHLAARMNDLTQFRNGFLESLKREIKKAGKTPIYSTILGDLAWDTYWYKNNYGPKHLMQTLTDEGYPIILFPVIGNHDNNGAIPAGKDCDFLSSGMFRKVICPNYYSYNLGEVHYVVLDDIYYKNTETGGKYNKGIVGSRNYDAYITPTQFNWLRKDLEQVDKETPIIVGVHIPVWNLRQNTFEVFPSLTSHNNENSSEALCELLKDFKQVLIISGHTHYNYHAHPEAYPNIHENNIAAICATWWTTGELSGRHICKDGSPGGYELFTIRGKDIKWQYHSTEKNGDVQFRLYDMNKVKEFYQTDETMKAILKKYDNRLDYGSIGDNLILLNVFNYDTDWKIEVKENGISLPIKRVTTEDPLHTLAYDVPKFKADGVYGTGSAAGKTSHIFFIQASTATEDVNVRVTDSFGQVYTSKFHRPAPFTIEIP
ncbi:MAG: calcineurin-like phosphoesterase C-terminal domain-containing protein [Bacteroidaceae bacterium]|nr:calcineurin-like phosphoesterase C-terminal domain-containing protein [Bacteroidaceae bacterium]